MHQLKLVLLAMFTISLAMHCVQMLRDGKSDAERIGWAFASMASILWACVQVSFVFEIWGPVIKAWLT